MMLLKAMVALLVFAVAKPGYRYEFPRDHYSHPGFRTEWWYWTGNLRDTSSGRRFGFELTFFRQAVSEKDRAPQSTWDPVDLFLAHLALSDISAGRFHHQERINRAGPGLAGIDASRGIIWNGNWHAGLTQLAAVSPEFSLNLDLSTVKPPVIHGVDGVSAKAAGEGHASHYISFTRLEARGTLSLEGHEFTLTGTAWMDHEFFTHQLEPDQAGWDWMSIQLNDRTELMLFRLRRKDGSLDPFSAGTYINAAGQARHLTAADFKMTPTGEKWNNYPVAWRVEVPSLGLRLDASTPMRNQELGGDSPFTPSIGRAPWISPAPRVSRPESGISK